MTEKNVNVNDKVSSKGLTLEERTTRLAAYLAQANLFEPGQVIELRALAVKQGWGGPHIEAGWFDTDHIKELAKCALLLTLNAKGVYFTLNPLNPDLLSRRCNRVDRAQEGELSKDKDVLRRRWLLIDADPVRDALISATDDEKAHALDTIKAVRDYLTVENWPAPIFADSGNGYHLLYRVELPAADGGTVERILKALAAKFNSDKVHVDTTVHNASRICKLPGTMARKGDSTPTRPHRRAKYLEVPGL